ncbi:Rho GTPase activation protein [Penicillium riverlandense]|uniref:Rho GTPase activation protein n=1 Tax=Penicillium riverlandense TaxID=1903569 RepID=UPI002546C98E|nr:Rho GTPase activation protein [Penicillium riverlandense]KAJ5832542.1 Rho GTPase activation protein [Penicillium riverlandense]
MSAKRSRNPVTLPPSDTVAIVGGPSPCPKAFPSGDLLGLPIMEDDQQLWDLSPVSPSMGGVWDMKPDATVFANSLERDLKNAQVRNGQPTPPPYDDQAARVSGILDTDNATQRRRVREAKTAAASLSPDLDFDDSPRQERAKRAKFLERNRLAASKCRQKKKEHTQQLEVRFKEQSEKNAHLHKEIHELKSQALNLKNELLKHAQCNDEAIKLHLSAMVSKITENNVDPQAAQAGAAAAGVVTDVSAELPDAGTVPVAAEPAEMLPTPRPPVPTVLSFGFDDTLQLEPAAAAAAAEAFEQQLRRDSEASLDSSYTFSADETFDDLINV